MIWRYRLYTLKLFYIPDTLNIFLRFYHVLNIGADMNEFLFYILSQCVHMV